MKNDFEDEKMDKNKLLQQVEKIYKEIRGKSAIMSQSS